jgi:hypothetical protein
MLKFDFKQITGWLIIIVLLMPTLFFPFSGDLSVFMQCSTTIINGGKLYVDIVDIKPPLVYYLLAFAGKIFGTSEFSIRVFDFIYQMAAIISLYFLMLKFTNNKSIGLITGVIYSLSYSILHYSNTVQSETFASLLIVWIIFLHFSEKKYLSSLLKGACIGLLMGLKYTMGLALIAVILDELIRNKFPLKILLNRSLLTIAGTVLLFSITLFPLLDIEIRNGFFETLKYVQSYSTNPPINSEFFKNSLKQTGYFFGDIFSITLLISVFIAIFQSFGFTLTNSKKETNDFIKFLILLSICLFVSIVFERKYITYHFTRLYIPLIAMSGIGIYSAFIFLKDKYKLMDRYSRFIIILLVLISFIFSPFPRILNLMPISYYFFKDKEKYNALFEAPESATKNRQQHLKIAATINPYLHKDDLVVVMNSGGNIINSLMKTNRKTKFTQSCFYCGSYYKGMWQKEIFDEIKMGKWLVIQTNDRIPHIFGHNFSTFEMIEKDTAIIKYIHESYLVYDTTGNYILFKRK